MELIEKFILAIIVIVVLIIIALLVIFQVNKINKDNITEQDPDEADVSSYLDDQITMVKDYNMYYSITNAIALYYGKIGEKDSEAVYNMLDKKHISLNGMTKENILEKVEKVESEEPIFKVEQMYISDDYLYPIYYVKGTLKDYLDSTNWEECHLIISIDNANTTFAISKIDNERYNEIISLSKKEAGEQIPTNNNNNFYYINIDAETICANLLYDYKLNAKENPQKAYNSLDEEYRKKRFGSLEEYKKYVSNSKMLENIMLSEYSKTVEEEYTRYICIDQYGNYYIFKETAVMQYSLILDTYTIDLPEFLAKYNEASQKDKGIYNIQKFFEAINQKDYKYAYNVLDESYKNKNFKTQQEFENYVKTTFFDVNKAEYSNYEVNGDLNIYTITISDQTGKKEESTTKTFVVKLLEETEFVMSMSL